MDASTFRCRKGYYAINVIGICDFNLKLTYVAACYAGTAHDSNVFQESDIFKYLEERTLEGGVLCDSAYGNNNFIFKCYVPKKGEHLTEGQEEHNSSHMSTRNHIERCFGVLKNRFPILRNVHCGVLRAQSIVMACSVLYNLMRSESESFIEISDYQIEKYIHETKDIDSANPEMKLQDRICKYHFGK